MDCNAVSLTTSIVLLFHRLQFLNHGVSEECFLQAATFMRFTTPCILRDVVVV